MKIAIILSFAILSLVVVLAKFTNYSARLLSKDKRAAREHICTDMLSHFSMNTAIMVNTSFSCKNGPVRPLHESFCDGILNEITKTHDPELPECKLMDIRSFVVDNHAEDANGTL